MSSSGVPLRKVLFGKPQKESSGLAVLIKPEGAFPLGCVVYLHTVTVYLGPPSLHYEKRYFCIHQAEYIVDPPKCLLIVLGTRGDASLRDFSISSWYFFANKSLFIKICKPVRLLRNVLLQDRNHLFWERAGTELSSSANKTSFQIDTLQLLFPSWLWGAFPNTPVFGDIFLCHLTNLGLVEV